MSLELIYTYNRLSVRVVQARVKVILPSAIVRAVAQDLQDWLEENEFPAGPYIASCFAKHSWAYVPAFEALARPKYAKHYRDNAEEAAMWWRQHEIDREAHTPLELSPGKEIVKSRFRYDGREKACRAQPELSGGFNQLSRHCQTCPEKEECRAGRNNASARQ